MLDKLTAPILQQIIDKNGLINRTWAMFFRDISKKITNFEEFSLHEEEEIRNINNIINKLEIDINNLKNKIKK